MCFCSTKLLFTRIVLYFLIGPLIRKMISEILLMTSGERPAPPRDPLMTGDGSIACGRQVAPWHRRVALPESKFSVFFTQAQMGLFVQFSLADFFFFLPER